LLAGRAHLIFFFLGEATFASDRSKCAIGFQFWEGSRYFWSAFFSGFPVFLLFIFCWSDFPGFQGGFLRF
jgi:hypothetical protein